jgi:predicted nucleic acid-binding protein
MSAADAVYVALAEQLGAHLLTDDHRLIRTPSFPASVPVLQHPLR